jgi:anaerobic magnesium-protoporphyrin IX monomethyl ester cyclase
MTQSRDGISAEELRVLLLHPPVLPFGYTLHHRFQRIWEVGEYLRHCYPLTTIMDAGLLNCLKGQVLHEFAKEYDILALYCEPQMLPEVIDLAERCRYISPKTRIMIYGPAAACFPAQAFGPNIDAIGRYGDLEAQIRQFIDLHAGKDTKTSNISLRLSSEIKMPQGKPEFIPPAQWGFPSLGDMPIGDISRVYQMKAQGLTVAVTASRGCPYRCTFCATPAIEGGPDRRRPAKALAHYIKENSEYDLWQFYSPTFTLNRRWCLEFFSCLRAEKVNISWRCTTRVDRLDEELVREMAACGCCMVGIGVETLGPALTHIRKEITQAQVRQAINLLTSHGIQAKAYVIFGLPGQSLQDVHETIDFLKDLGAIVRPSLYSPQGEADELADTDSVPDLSAVSQLDRRSFLADRENYGEFLRLTFDRAGIWPQLASSPRGS